MTFVLSMVLVTLAVASEEEVESALELLRSAQASYSSLGERYGKVNAMLTDAIFYAKKVRREEVSELEASKKPLRDTTITAFFGRPKG